MSVGDALALARQALVAGDEQRALESVIDGWRASRSAAIARVAESLSKRFEPHLPALAGKLDDFQPLWLAIAKQQRAVDLPRLLGSVLHGTDRFGVAVVDALVARGKELATWPADPRASTIIVDHLVRGGYESTSKSTYPFWSEMFAMLETHADPRVFERLSKVRYGVIFRNFSDGKRRIAWFQEQLDAVTERLASTTQTTLTSAMNERVTKLAKLVATRRPIAASEVARIAQQPSVPAPKPKKRAPSPKLDAKSGRTHVDAAVRALRAGDDAAAVRELLAAWRTTRSARLADLTERVSKRCEGKLDAIEGKSRKAIHETWLATCREQRAEDVPRLLDSVTHTHLRATDALERVKAFASWPSDPRTLACVLRALEMPPFHSSSSKPFWTAFVALAVDHLDPRAADAFEALAARYDRVLVAKYTDLSGPIAWFRKLLVGAAAELRARVPVPEPLDAATARVCDELEALVSVEDALLAEIYANPADDHPRRVYADLLQQRGDPRGEFIALQLAGNRTRADELLARHAPVWLRPFTAFASAQNCVFERGFVAELAFYEDSQLHAVIGHPAWSTVTRLHLPEREYIPETLLAQPVMRGLETVTRYVSGKHRKLKRGPDGYFLR